MATISELKRLLPKIKTAIKWQNDHANWAKVQELKRAKKRIKNKILELKKIT